MIPKLNTTPRPIRRVLLPVVVAALAIAWASCGRADNEHNPEDAKATAVHVVLEQPGWNLQRAIHFRGGSGKLAEHEPGLDWFAEYDGLQENDPDGSWCVRRVRVSGHAVPLSTLQEVVAGADFTPGELHRRRMLVGPPGEDVPSLVLIEMRPEYSVMVVSHDADVRPLADQLVVVNEAAWVERGGKMIDCVPLTPGCSLTDDTTMPPK